MIQYAELKIILVTPNTWRKEGWQMWIIQFIRICFIPPPPFMVSSNKSRTKFIPLPSSPTTDIPSYSIVQPLPHLCPLLSYQLPLFASRKYLLFDQCLSSALVNQITCSRMVKNAMESNSYFGWSRVWKKIHIGWRGRWWCNDPHCIQIQILWYSYSWLLQIFSICMSILKLLFWKYRTF